MDENVSPAPAAVPIKQLLNERTLTIYGAILFAWIVSVVASKQRRIIVSKSRNGASSHPCRDSKRQSTDRRSKFGQFKRRISARLSCTSESLYVMCFCILNALLCVTIIDRSRINHLASRFGWMAAANMAFCVFLGLKNTPLTKLGKPHNELYSLHRFVGYTAIVQTALHGTLYTLHFFFSSRLWRLLGPGNWEGLAAGSAMIMLLLGLSRNLRYNIFLISHILGAAAATGFVAFHRPDWKKKLPYVMLTITLIWGFDRLIRLRRFLSNLSGNRAALYPFPNGVSRLVLTKPLKNAKPGLHCFLWLPELFFLRTHPFSIVSITSSEMEFVIKAHDGFTKRLHELALECPGRQLRVYVDGPYGSIPDWQYYQSIILVAGGSGAAYTFGLASTILQGRTGQQLSFLWAVKNRVDLTWFSRNLEDMERSPHVDVSVYVTRHDPDSDVASIGTYSAESNPRNNDCADERRPLLQGGASIAHNYMGCMEAGLGEADSLQDKAVAKIFYKKLDLEKVLSERTEASSPVSRVLIAVCGPRPMADAVHQICRKLAVTKDIGIDVHSEAFSW